MDLPNCRTCGSGSVSRVGRLPAAYSFAGRNIDEALPGGSLWRCNGCHLVFRHPLLPERTYSDLYENGSPDVWEPDTDRRDFYLVRQQLGRANAGVHDVLDFGCYTGYLLSGLHGEINRYGVEMNKAAAAIARSRGIRIVAEDMKGLLAGGQRFDYVIACDVIEHLSDPLAFLRDMHSCLKQHGRLIVTTGNAGSWLWRLTGSRFWYAYFPEHISFISRRWVDAVQANSGLQAEEVRSFNYLASPSMTTRIKAFIGALAYAASPPLFQKISHHIGRSKDHTRSPPGCGASRDHLFLVFSVR